MAWPTFGIEATNPLFYFNAVGFVLSILILRRLRERDGGGAANALWGAAWVVCIGTGLHFLGDLTGVSEDLDHQFIHFVLMAALAVGFVALRRGD